MRRNAHQAFVTTSLLAISICASLTSSLISPWALASDDHFQAECITQAVQALASDVSESDVNDFVKNFVDRDLLTRNPNFNDFLRTKGLKWDALAPEVQAPTIAEYVRKEVVATYQGEKLEELQAEALQEILESHGIKTTTEKARAKLEEISQRNVARILRGKNTIPSAETQKLLDHIPKLTIYYIHNTNELREAPKLPLLSSRQLDRLGIKQGLNSNYEYNRNFLRSDNSVFFYALPARSAREAIKKTNFSYGSESILLNQPYADNAGIISLFNMYPASLAKGKHLSAPQARTLSKLPLPWRGVENDPIDPATLKVWERARNRLYRLDFTPKDYESMVQKLFIASLNRISAEDPAQFKTVSFELTNQASNTTDTLQNLIFKMNGLDLEYEMKIPVAVPAKATSSISKN